MAVAYGRPARGAGEVRESYREARVALGIARRLHRTGATSYQELRSFTVLAEIADTEHSRQLVREVLGPLRSGPDLLDTLVAYLAEGGNVNATARALNVHRNTMLAKLDRISRALGMDMRVPENQFTAWLGDPAGPAQRGAVRGRPRSQLPLISAPLRIGSDERPGQPERDETADTANTAGYVEKSSATATHAAPTAEPPNLIRLYRPRPVPWAPAGERVAPVAAGVWTSAMPIPVTIRIGTSAASANPSCASAVASATWRPADDKSGPQHPPRPQPVQPAPHQRAQQRHGGRHREQHHARRRREKPADQVQRNRQQGRAQAEHLGEGRQGTAREPRFGHQPHVDEGIFDPRAVPGEPHQRRDRRRRSCR